MKEAPVALIIDPDDFIRKGLSTVFRSCGFVCVESATYVHPSRNGVAEYTAILCEIELAQSVGLALFVRQFHEHSKRAKVLLTSSRPSGGQTLDAVAAGAYDFLVTPSDPEELKNLCWELRDSTPSADASFADRLGPAEDTMSPLVGRSKAFIETVKQVGRVAPTNLPVFLIGESGTGKEVVASVLHQRSNRSDGPFVPVNCAAMPAELIESELFGHVKGSFTGADKDRSGLWEQADGGTIFLDEITETSTAFQVKLLRTIQHGEVRRVGANTTQRFDVRVVAASNRDVDREVSAGRFRQDLFYRLNAISVRLPSLRDRKDDIPLLVESFVKRFSGKRRPRFSPEALEMLSLYSWPGNIRELENVVLGSVAVCKGVITVKDLPERIRTSCQQSVIVTEGHQTSNLSEPAPCEPENWQTLAVLQGEYVMKALNHTKWNKQAAARLLAIDRKTLDRMIKRHSLIAGVTDLRSRAA